MYFYLVIKNSLVDVLPPFCEQERINLNKQVAEIRKRLSTRSNKHVIQLVQGLSPEWFIILAKQIESEKFQKLATFVMNEIQHKITVYPPIEQVVIFIGFLHFIV